MTFINTTQQAGNKDFFKKNREADCFFEKKKQKTLSLPRAAPLTSHARPCDYKYVRATPFLLCLAVCLTRLPVLHRSVLDWDESLYALMAQQWHVGHLPYSTIWDNKPVGIYAILALLQVAAPPVLSLRLASMICVSALALTVWRLTWHLTGNASASLAAGFVLVVASLSNDGLAANTELFMALFTALAVLAALGDGRPLARGFVTGLCLGTAFMIKYVMVFEGAAILLLLLNQQGGRALGAAVLGGMLPIAAVVALYAQAGQLELWWVCSVASNFRRADAPITAGALSYALRTECLRWGPLFCALPALISARRGRWCLGLWLLGGCLGVVGAKSFYDHYFLQLLPILSIACGLLIARLPRLRVLATLALLALPAAAAINALREATLPDIPAEIAAILPTGSLYVFDSQPILYALTGETPPTRFVLPTVLTGFLLPHVAGVDPVAEVSRILDQKPQFIIRRNPPPALQTPVYALLDAHLAAHYHLWRHFLLTDVYQLNPPTGARKNVSNRR